MASSSVICDKSLGKVTTKEMDLPNGKMYKFFANDKKLSYKDGLHLMGESEEFRHLLKNTILKPNYPAVFWEFPPVSQKSSPNFEFVVMKASGLKNVQTDLGAFQSYFRPKCNVVSFPNLGGDAQLITPCPISKSVEYAHLVTFLRTATDTHIHELLMKTAQEMQFLLLKSCKTIWLSTSGLGVYYLHIRLDSYAKYYTYLPYRKDNHPTD